MNIDFSKKPEGATHFYRTQWGHVGSWWKISTTKSSAPAFVFSPIDGQWVAFARVPGNIQPIPDDRPWTGKGFPPVGIDCEYLDVDTKQWMPGEILATRNNAWIIYGYNYDVGLFTLESIRPIRTAEQILAEEREKAIEDLIHVTCINRGEAALIYDAGYRKQEAK